MAALAPSSLESILIKWHVPYEVIPSLSDKDDTWTVCTLSGGGLLSDLIIRVKSVLIGDPFIWAKPKIGHAEYCLILGKKLTKMGEVYKETGESIRAKIEKVVEADSEERINIIYTFTK